MVLVYLVGFAGVWAAVALGWGVLVGYRHFYRNWDRAFIKELEGTLELPTR